MEDTDTPGRTAGREVLNNMELTSMIFQFLRDGTLIEAGLKLVGGAMQTMPKSWTSIFARLALVNNAFFHASTDVLWENMTTVEPFFGLLLQADSHREDGHMHGTGILSYYWLITQDEWDRFEIYSRKVKNLALIGANSLKIRTPWLLYLSRTKLQPKRLFPTLKRLFLTSSDDISLFVAMSVAPYIKSLTIHLGENPQDPTQDACMALTSILCELTSVLSELRILNPITPVLTPNVFEISGITSLSLTVNSKLEDLKLAEISYLTFLEKLELQQTVKTDRIQFPTTIDIQAAIARVPSKPGFENQSLRELTVTGGGSLLYEIAATISPRFLKALRLEVIPDISYKSMALVPLAIAIYAHRNKSLTSLVVNCPTRGRNRAEDLLPLRDDMRFRRAGDLLAALSTLHDLKTLCIDKLPFLAVDINVDVLRVVQNLKGLESLRLRTKPMTSASDDELVVPPLQYLEDLSRNNLNLSEVEMEIDMSTIPDIPTDYTSTNALRHLYLYPSSTSRAISNGERLRMARYIDRLFPQVKKLRSDAMKGSPLWELWGHVEEMVSHTQEVRAQAIRDLARSNNADL
ncbi:hypothetical protein D9611_011205 [Ephemerocybe angulata]|uniref:Uncharacterized protein n=1 Tax=Ephemerocybe angulata TaxID=980116 RepID=A0A8H5CCA7_9AGAR|nr:hypothetical protein D9611_011205 [Tulosesus angulatus]